MPALYAPAVQGAFELISAAYSALSDSSASEGSPDTDGGDRGDRYA